ncbi:MAG TPA: preprotein translocase subunit SecG [Fimbriiglobus sp.]|nr:preprotein translocase subunit SecG [Fimbriiglobus sp.]
MPLFANASTWSVLLNVVVLLLSILLMFIVLIQRGKGGGLAGAFGGVGGSSPFGSRAGDTFTKITLYMAAVWVLFIMIHVKVAQMDGKSESQRPTISSNP